MVYLVLSPTHYSKSLRGGWGRNGERDRGREGGREEEEHKKKKS